MANNLLLLSIGNWSNIGIYVLSLQIIRLKYKIKFRKEPNFIFFIWFFCYMMYLIGSGKILCI